MLLFHHTLVSKPLISHLQILYFLPLPPHHRPLLPDVLLRLLLPLPREALRVLQWNAGGLQFRSTELLHFLSSHHVNLICIPESNLNSSSSFLIPVFSALHSDCTNPRSGILSPDTTHSSGRVISFVKQGLSFSKHSTSSFFLRLIPTLFTWGSTSLLTTPPRSHLLMCMPPLFPLPQRMAKPTPFLPPFFPSPEISSFWGISIAITPFGTQEVLPNPVGRKISIGSSLLTSSPSMILTQPPFSITPLAVASLLTFPLLPLFLPSLALGRCFMTLVLITYQFFYPTLFLWSSPPMSVPLPSIFRKLGGMTLLPTLPLTVLLQKNTHLSLSLSFAVGFFSSLALNAAKSSIPFGRIKHPPKAWWSSEVEQAVSEKR